MCVRESSICQHDQGSTLSISFFFLQVYFECCTKKSFYKNIPNHKKIQKYSERISNRNGHGSDCRMVTFLLLVFWGLCEGAVLFHKFFISFIILFSIACLQVVDRNYHYHPTFLWKQIYLAFKMDKYVYISFMYLWLDLFLLALFESQYIHVLLLNYTTLCSYAIKLLNHYQFMRVFCIVNKNFRNNSVFLL